jgi:para-nitrobenzyl esterase
MSNEVVTTAGRVAGAAADGVVSFRGVPYGAPTGGAGRFRPPTAPEAWDGVRPATSNGLACPQPAMELPGIVAAMEPEPQGEDCLVVNVFTPAADDARRPVMVWLHGGAWTVGSGNNPGYDGSNLARRGDVVVVTVNHRLGLLGFLYLAELGGDAFADSGNVATLDMVAALEWVRDNIAAFGGDPGNVTIFGESGGGWKVSTLLGSPRAAGLFHRAVVQSGPLIDAVDPVQATTAAKGLLDQVGASSVDELISLPVEQLVAAQLQLTGGALGGNGVAIGPVLDGRTIPRHMFEPDPAPSARQVPVLIGTCKDEMTLFSLGLDAERFDEEALRKAAAEMFGDRADVVLEAYRSGRPDATPMQLYVAMGTDRFRVGSIRIAERLAAVGSAPVWMYRFDYESPLWGGRLGAPHAMEIPFVFDNLGVEGGLSLHGDRPDAQDLADRVSEAWLSFARTGDPNHRGLPSWPQYDADRRATLMFDSACAVVDDPDGQERQVWDGVKLSTF